MNIAPPRKTRCASALIGCLALLAAFTLAPASARAASVYITLNGTITASDGGSAYAMGEAISLTVATNPNLGPMDPSSALLDGSNWMVYWSQPPGSEGEVFSGTTSITDGFSFKRLPVADDNRFTLSVSNGYGANQTLADGQGNFSPATPSVGIGLFSGNGTPLASVEASLNIGTTEFPFTTATLSTLEGLTPTDLVLPGTYHPYWSDVSIYDTIFNPETNNNYSYTAEINSLTFSLSAPAVPEPSRVLLLIAGLGSLLLRRRRA